MRLFTAALRGELTKVYLRPRSYLGFAFFLLLAGAFALLFHYKPPWGELNRAGGQFVMVGNTFNALTMTRYMLAPTTYLFLPLITCVVAGDIFAAEYASGTIRTLLCRPAGRFRIFAAKLVVATFHAFLLATSLGVFGLAIGGAVLGFDSLVSWDKQLLIVGIPEGLQRLAISYALVWVGVLPMVCLTVIFSTLTDNSARAVVGAVSVLFISYVVMQLDAMEAVKDYWFTTHNDLWHYSLRAPIEWSELARDGGVAVAYAVAFALIALAIFARKDVKC